MRVRPLLLGVALLAMACGGSPQADASYPGEPLVGYGGLIQVGEATPPPFEVELAWQPGLPPELSLLRLAGAEAGSTRWTATFPYDFQTTVYQPPPADVFVQLGEGEPWFARANTVTVPAGIRAEGVAALPGSANPAYGTDLTHWLVYLSSSVPRRSLTEWWLRGEGLGAGYHYVRVDTPRCLSAEELDACAAELVDRGLPDDGTAAAGTARAFCLALLPYRATPVSWDEGGEITLGTAGYPHLPCPRP